MNQSAGSMPPPKLVYKFGHIFITYISGISGEVVVGDIIAGALQTCNTDLVACAAEVQRRLEGNTRQIFSSKFLIYHQWK